MLVKITDRSVNTLTNPRPTPVTISTKPHTRNHLPCLHIFKYPTCLYYFATDKSDLCGCPEIPAL